MLQLHGRTQQHSADGMHTRVLLYRTHACYLWHWLALYLYVGVHKPRERLKFDQPYLSDKQLVRYLLDTLYVQ